jgi:hypothetical protein
VKPTVRQQRDFVNLAYLLFLRWECEGFFTSLKRANLRFIQAGRGSDVKSRGKPHEQAFRDMHSALAFAANISKMLWNIKCKDRARQLRRVLGIRGRYKVLSDKRLRNAFEHLDERIDEWVTRSEKHIIGMHLLVDDWRRLPGVDQTDVGTRKKRYTCFPRGSKCDLEIAVPSMARFASSMTQLAP